LANAAAGWQKRDKVPADLNCSIPDGWNAIAKREPKFVVFGELHGTRQGPEFIDGLVCALAKSGKSVLLGIEHDARDNAALQQAWVLPDEQFPTALAKIHWSGRTDGVASEAMFAMLVRLHALRQRGFPIHVVAFNSFRDQAQTKRFANLPGQGPHEAAQADNIQAAAKAGRYDVVIALVGNFHANIAPVTWSNATFDPMARRLALHGKVISLDMRYGDGTSWNCQLKAGVKPVLGVPTNLADIECAVHPVIGYPDAVPARSIRLDASTKSGSRKYDGYYRVGPIEGSPPAVK
jgi:hypothetical protein